MPKTSPKDAVKPAAAKPAMFLGEGQPEQIKLKRARCDIGILCGEQAAAVNQGDNGLRQQKQADCGGDNQYRNQLQALRQWRIKPHTFTKIKVPCDFTLSGDEAALLRSIGDNLLYAIPPRYPFAAAAHGVIGRGRFQLIIDPSTGLVTDVRTLQTTHDQRLDAILTEQAFVEVRGASR